MNSVFKTIAVLKGGVGSERTISLKSGSAVADALRECGLHVYEIDIDDINLHLPNDVEAVFPVLHGEMGEDGFIQRQLETLQIPFVGSRSWEMPKSFDKEITHALLATRNIPMAPWEMVGKTQTVSMQAPLVLKAPRQGSSIGLEIAYENHEIPLCLEKVRDFDERILVEKYIEGSECTAGIIGDQVLPLVQINPRSGTFDFEAKYARQDTGYVVPAPYPDALTTKIQTLALEAYTLLGGRHLGRVDFRVDKQGFPFVLEMNPLPGFTATSLLPKAAKAYGLDFQSLCVRIMNQAEVI